MSMRRLFLAVALLALSFAALPARAAVTITFWSHDFGNYFPHTFFTLRGRPDAGGEAVDADYGFTARSVTPALLFGNVGGKVESAPRDYIEGSHARFSVVLSDAQYGEIVALVRGWSEKTGNSTYNLGKRNCVHFVREAARVAGLDAIDQPKLMKKPGRYLLAVEAANVGRIILVEQMGRDFLATLPPLDGVKPVAAPVATPGKMPAKSPAPAPAPIPTRAPAATPSG